MVVVVVVVVVVLVVLVLVVVVVVVVGCFVVAWCCSRLFWCGFACGSQCLFLLFLWCFFVVPLFLFVELYEYIRHTLR